MLTVLAAYLTAQLVALVAVNVAGARWASSYR